MSLSRRVLFERFHCITFVVQNPDAVVCTPIIFPQRIFPLVRFAPTFILAPKLCNAVASRLLDIKEISSLNLTRNFSIPDTNCGSSESKCLFNNSAVLLILSRNSFFFVGKHQTVRLHVILSFSSNAPVFFCICSIM